MAGILLSVLVQAVRPRTLERGAPVRKQIKLFLAAAALTMVGSTAAYADAVVCGNSSLGIRTTTVDPGLTGGFCYGGLDNLGDGALVSLLNTQLGLTAPETSVLINRDTTNNNGGALNITGVGATTGGWSFTSSLWNTYERMFLYFHFGDSRDCTPVTSGSSTCETDPDIFIVELKSPDSSGEWTFSGQQGLSNIALLGYDEGRVPPGGNIPEPGTASIALLSFGVMGGMAALRRRRGNSAK